MEPRTAPLVVAACALVLAAMPVAAPSQAQDSQAAVPDGFAKTDTNQSGEVDPDEFRARILEIFQILDANQDGRIELLEVPARRRQVFPSVDTDRSGGVDQAEFMAFVMPRFASADTDKNGLLTATEVQAADEFEYKLNAPSVFELSDRNGDGRVDEGRSRTVTAAYEGELPQ